MLSPARVCWLFGLDPTSNPALSSPRVAVEAGAAAEAVVMLVMKIEYFLYYSHFDD